MTAVLAATLPPRSGRAAEPDAEPAAIGRLAGSDRYATAVVVARDAFPDGANEVYLARGDDPADALAAGALTDGPVLLVPRCGGVPSIVTEEVARLDPTRVTALGGPAAVCDEVLATVAGGRGTRRLAGPDRIATALAIAEEAFPDGAEVAYLASADSPDALAAGSLTAGPVLLVGDLPDERVATAVDRLDPAVVRAVGGTAAVSTEVLHHAAGDRTTGRLAGIDRYATALAVAEEAFPGGSARVYLARADGFADALAAGALTDGPVLLVPPCDAVPADVVDAVRRAAHAIALGGERAVCDLLLRWVAGQPAPAPPLVAPTDPVTIARHLTFAEGTLRAGVDNDAWLLTLARTQQTAYRRLGEDAALRDPTYAALPPGLVPIAVEQVTAHAELRAMLTQLRDEPPDTWQIVEAAPVSELRGYYAEAEDAYGVPWYVLAAIHLVETRFSRIHGTSTAGAQGPMQFMPSTWEAYGEGDVYDDHDAIMAAARYLVAHGAPEDLASALYAYNHDQRYVRAVTRHAQLLAGDDDLLAAYHRWGIYYLTTSGELLLETGWPDVPATRVE